MAISKLWMTLPFLLMWAEGSWSKEIKYEDLAHSIRSNQKFKALTLSVESEREKTGFFTRSFVPELKVFAGQEEYNSDGLGNHSSSYYGIEARANIFNGMSDYWEEKRRKSQAELSEIQKKISYSEMVYEAKKSYLRLAEALKIKTELNESLSRLSRVFKKVRLKIKSGVISRSELTSLRLVQVEFEHKIKDLDGVIILNLARLKSLLSLPDLNINDIDDEALNLPPTQRRLPKKSLLEKKFKVKSDSFNLESKVLSGTELPSVDFLAKFGRQPFSEREFSEDSKREEWSAGFQLTWKIGAAWENSRQAQSSKLKAQASEALSGYSSSKAKYRIEALNQKRKSLRDSIVDLEGEISLNRNYYSQISSEYLRGVKSTSDLTSTFGQLLEIKRHRLDLLLQYHLAQAEIERVLGEF